MKKENRFTVSYFQDEHDEMIVILKDNQTNNEYLQIISDKGVAITALQGKKEKINM